MDAFEQIVAILLHREHYWVQSSYKIELTFDDKKQIGLPSCPRWEVDVVAYRPKENELLAVECKSLLNSPGVRLASLTRPDAKAADRYKLFNDANLRRVVLARLGAQLVANGLLLPNPKPRLCLAAGHIYRGDKEKVRRLCAEMDWGFYGPDWFAKQFADAAKWDYENDIAIMAAKLAAGMRE